MATPVRVPVPYMRNEEAGASTLALRIRLAKAANLVAPLVRVKSPSGLMKTAALSSRDGAVRTRQSSCFPDI